MPYDGPGAQRQLTDCRPAAGAISERRQEVADLDVLDVEQLQRDPDDQDAAGAGHRSQRVAALGEDRVEEPGAERDPALVDQDVTAAKATPSPSDAASAMEAKPSSIALVAAPR